MAVVTKISGARGIVQIGGVTVPVSDFKINFDRGVVVQKRVGKYSDRKYPGKVDIKGSLTFQDISGVNISRLLATTAGTGNAIGAGVVFNLTGEGTDGTSNVKVTANNCFYTSASMEFGDANTPIDGSQSFAMEDADVDLDWEYTT
jgi:hypothetical protein